jgi:hypothetical protein
MGDIKHDSTFAFRVAKAKSRNRYNGKICPRCERIYSADNGQCPHCAPEKEITVRRIAARVKKQSTSTKLPKTICGSGGSTGYFGFCSYCGNRMPATSIAGHIIRKHSGDHEPKELPTAGPTNGEKCLEKAAIPRHVDLSFVPDEKTFWLKYSAGAEQMGMSKSEWLRRRAWYLSQKRSAHVSGVLAEETKTKDTIRELWAEQQTDTMRWTPAELKRMAGL